MGKKIFRHIGFSFLGLWLTDQHDAKKVVCAPQTKGRIFKLLIISLLLASCGSGQRDELYEQAKQRMDAGQFAEAVSLLDEVIKEDEAYAAAYNMRGVAYVNLRESAKAMSDFEQAIALDTADYRGYYNRGNLLQMLNRSNEALPAYDRAIALSPNSADLYLKRGIARLDGQLLYEALDDLNRADGLSGGKEKLVPFYRGKIYFQVENFEKAKLDFQKCIELDSTFAEAYHSLALSRIVTEGKTPAPETCALLRQSVELGFTKAQELVDAYCE